MKIRMVRDDEVRLTPAVVRAYRKYHDYAVPKAIGDRFVKSGSAVPATTEHDKEN